MKAVVYHGPGDIRVEERPNPVPRDDNIIARVRCCAICGTDMKLAESGNPRCHPPRIIGHEMVGVVTHVGSKVEGFSEGNRITLATTIACGKCSYCLLGLGNVCPNATPISYDYDGALAELITIPWSAIEGRNVIKVPENVSDDDAALAEPLSCAINAQELAGVKPGDTVLVVGGGPLGALHGLLAEAVGVAQVMVTQRSEPRLSMLRELGKFVVINASQEDVRQAVLERTDGLGASVVIVTAPSKEAQEQAITLVRKGGAISLFASLPKDSADITLDSRAIHYGELRIVGASDSRPEHVARAIELMVEGKIIPSALVTHRIPLADIHTGLNLMKQKLSLKVMVDIWR